MLTEKLKEKIWEIKEFFVCRKCGKKHIPVRIPSIGCCGISEFEIIKEKHILS